MPLEDKYYEKDAYDRICHWVGLLYRQMRWSGEDGCGEMFIYDRALYENMKTDEPAIDCFLPIILTRLAVMWQENPEDFIKSANSGMKTDFKVSEGEHSLWVKEERKPPKLKFGFNQS